MAKASLKTDHLQMPVHEPETLFSCIQSTVN